MFEYMIHYEMYMMSNKKIAHGHLNEMTMFHFFIEKKLFFSKMINLD
jgi:hypothetical protein